MSRDAQGTAALRPPSGDDIVTLGQAVLESLPRELRAFVGDVPIVVKDWAEEDELAEVGIDDPLELSGLYRGTPIGERGGMTLPSSQPEMIFLFRLPLLFEWCQRGCALEEVVFDVLTHEIGHHFGMDEAEVLRMEGRGPEGGDND